MLFKIFFEAGEIDEGFYFDGFAKRKFLLRGIIYYIAHSDLRLTFAVEVLRSVKSLSASIEWSTTDYKHYITSYRRAIHYRKSKRRNILIYRASS